MQYSLDDEFLQKRLKDLNKSIFRGKFKLNAKEITYTVEKGLSTIEKHAYDILEKRLAPEIIENDGKQTPMHGHPVFVAQHATATCCRECLKKWHHIPQNRQLTADELSFCVKIIMAWIKNQLKGF